MNENNKLKLNDNKKYRSFGFLLIAISSGLFLYVFLSVNEVNIYLAVMSLVSVIITILRPSLLAPFYNKWMQFGLLLSKVMTPLVMGITYFCLMVPMGILIKVFKKDLIDKSVQKNVSSYWIVREQEMGSMEEQF